jgi:hypothetical protein
MTRKKWAVVAIALALVCTSGWAFRLLMHHKRRAELTEQLANSKSRVEIALEGLKSRKNVTQTESIVLKDLAPYVASLKETLEYQLAEHSVPETVVRQSREETNGIRRSLIEHISWVANRQGRVSSLTRSGDVELLLGLGDPNYTPSEMGLVADIESTGKRTMASIVDQGQRYFRAHSEDVARRIEAKRREAEFKAIAERAKFLRGQIEPSK